MLRRARILLALCALSTLCAAPALYAEEDPEGTPPPPAAGGPIEEILEWLGILGGEQGPLDDEFNPQHLPGG